MDKKTTDAEIKMRYQYSVRVLKTCVDVPDQVKEATEILKELAEGGYVEAQCSLGDYYSEGCYIAGCYPHLTLSARRMVCILVVAGAGVDS